jgi:hypothetical protein
LLAIAAEYGRQVRREERRLLTRACSGYPLHIRKEALMNSSPLDPIETPPLDPADPANDPDVPLTDPAIEPDADPVLPDED